MIGTSFIKKQCRANKFISPPNNDIKKKYVGFVVLVNFSQLNIFLFFRHICQDLMVGVEKPAMSLCVTSVLLSFFNTLII